MTTVGALREAMAREGGSRPEIRTPTGVVLAGMGAATRSDRLDAGAPPRACEALALDRLRDRLLGRGPRLRRVGRYVLGERLGAGGMAVVIRARDPELDRDVAIKLVQGRGRDRTDRERLQREARALARLSHPNVVEVFDVGVTGDDEVFLAMALVEGRTLAQRLAEGDVRLARAERLRWMIAAGRGLAAAHRVGLVHRDFKPDNVMVGDDGRVRVADFGLSRAANVPGSVPSTGDVPGDLTTLTRTRGIVGTPSYMAPEQHHGHAVDARTDVHAFCAVLFEVVYGVRPFVAQTWEGLLAAKLRPPVAPRSPSAPAWLWRVISRGLQPDPARRWPSMDALLEALVDRAAPRRPALGLVLGITASIGAAVVVPVVSMRSGSVAASVVASSASLGDLADRTVLVAGVQAQRDGDHAGAAARYERAFHGAVRRHDDSMARLAAARLAQVSVNGLAQPEDAERWLRHAQLGPSDRDPSTAIARRAAAALALTRGELDGAGVAFAALLREAQAGGDALSIAVALCDLGDVHHRRGDFESAASTRREAIARLADSGHADDPVYARAWAGLGDALQELARPAEARAAFERALALRRATLRPDHPEIAASLRDLGVAQIDAGEFESGQARLAEALEIYARTFGPGHPQIGVVHAAIGNGAADARDYHRARAHHERAVAVFTAAWGADDPRLGAELINLGVVRYKQGDDVAALSAFAEALRVLEAALGPDHPHVAAAAHAMGQTASRLHRPVEALGHLARAASIRERTLGASHPLTAQTQASRAAALRDLGLAATAVADFESAVATLAMARGSEDSLAHARWGLALSLADAGREGQRSRALAESALAHHRQRGGEADPNAVEIAAWLAARPEPR